MYGSASEVIREALRLFEAYQAVQAASLEALRADVEQGIAEVRAGRVSSVAMNDIKSKGREILRGKAAS
jgi:antitoxin ParD1/3/4